MAKLPLWEGSAKRRYFSAMEVFQDLRGEEIADIEQGSHMARFGKGEILYRPDEEAEVLFLLKEGRVQLYRLSPQGRKLVLATLDLNTFFGEMALVGLGMYGTFAEAVEDSLVCSMGRAELHRLLLRYPPVSLRFLEAMGRRIADIEGRLEAAAFKSVTARLAGLLLQMAGEGKEVTEVSHSDLAEMLGSYRETVTQALGELQAQGYLKIGRRKLQLLNVAGLKELAQD